MSRQPINPNDPMLVNIGIKQASKEFLNKNPWAFNTNLNEMEL